MAMVDLSYNNSDKPITLAQISQRQNIALNYLEQIFVNLRKAALVTAVKGPGGGYKLAKDIESISIAEILFAMNDSFKMTRCGASDHNSCMQTSAKCLTHNLWRGLENNIISYLKSVTLKDVINKKDFISLVTSMNFIEVQA